MKTRTLVAASFALALVGAGGAAASNRLRPARGETAEWVKSATLPAYAPQKVVYHVDYTGGFLSRRYKHLLQVARAHVEAMGSNDIDMRILLQGDGADLLSYARSDLSARAAIDGLKLRGVKFLVCRNTLLHRGLNPDRDLYDFARGDMARSAVAEITALETQGFHYIKLSG